MVCCLWEGTAVGESGPQLDPGIGVSGFEPWSRHYVAVRRRPLRLFAVPQFPNTVKIVIHALLTSQGSHKDWSSPSVK